MNNRELYATLIKKIGNTGTVYFRDPVGTYGRVRNVYAPARIMELKVDAIADALKVKISRTDYYEPPIDNVSVENLYLPSPMNSRFHGDMIPVRSYFEVYERLQGSRDSADALCYTIRYKAKAEQFEYDKIIFSGPCTIVIWKDGTKTMARVSEGDAFDPEKGVAICFMKRALGHTETNKTLKVADEMWNLKNTEQDAISKLFAGINIARVTAKPVNKKEN